SPSPSAGTGASGGATGGTRSSGKAKILKKMRKNESVVAANRAGQHILILAKLVCSHHLKPSPPPVKNREWTDILVISQCSCPEQEATDETERPLSLFPLLPPVYFF